MILFSCNASPFIWDQVKKKENDICEYKASQRVLKFIFKICIGAVHYALFSATDINCICSPRGWSMTGSEVAF